MRPKYYTCSFIHWGKWFKTTHWYGAQVYEPVGFSVQVEWDDNQGWMWEYTDKSSIWLIILDAKVSLPSKKNQKNLITVLSVWGSCQKCKRSKFKPNPQRQSSSLYRNHFVVSWSPGTGPWFVRALGLPVLAGSVEGHYGQEEPSFSCCNNCRHFWGGMPQRK